MKWNVVLYGLLFSGLGVFSYLLLANYSELPPQVSDILYSKGAFIFFISAFNILGYSTLRLSSWLNNQYALNLRKRWKIITIYIAVTLLFFLLNYSLLIIGKLLVGSYNIFILTLENITVDAGQMLGETDSVAWIVFYLGNQCVEAVE